MATAVSVIHVTEHSTNVSILPLVGSRAHYHYNSPFDSRKPRCFGETFGKGLDPHLQAQEVEGNRNRLL